MITSETVQRHPQPQERSRIPIYVFQQTPRTAFEHMKRELTDYPAWKKNDYSFSYGPPHHRHIEKAKKAGIEGDYSDEILQYVVENKIYPFFDFKPARRSVETAIPLVKLALPQLEAYQKQWGFKVMPKYEIELVVGTIGVGGSWQTKDHIRGGVPNGVITYWHDPKPEVVLRTPAERIVHEIVHIGIEELLTQICSEAGKPPLHQKSKERLVDLIVQKTFKPGLFPNYHKQGNQDKRMDPYITEESLLDIPTAIKRFIAENDYEPPVEPKKTTSAPVNS